MRRAAFATALIAMSVVNNAVAREVDPLLYAMRDNGRAYGKLVDEHTASIFGVIYGGEDSNALFAMAFYKAASFSSASGYEKFAIVRSRQKTTYLNFVPIVQNIRLTVVFLHLDEVVDSQDGQPVTYVKNSDATDHMKEVIALYHPNAQ